MNDDISRAIGEATANIQPPGFDFAAIRERAERYAPARHAKRGRSWLLAIAIVAAPCLVAAATIFPSPAERAAVAQKLHEWMSAHIKPGTQTSLHQLFPTTLERAQREARFHLVVPQGLPAGAVLDMIDGDDSGLTYSASYRLTDGSIVTFSLDKAQPNVKYVPWRTSFNAAVTKATTVPMRVWLTGDEVVTVDTDALTDVEFAKVKSAMHAHDAPLYKGKTTPLDSVLR